MKIDKEKVEKAVQTLVDESYALAEECGWWHDPKTGEPIKADVPLQLCLIHSEVSEALEGFRKDLMDDKLPHRSMLEVELADVAIRVFNMAGGMGMDLAGAIAEKLEYNSQREDHKLENRLKEGGKKF